MRANHLARLSLLSFFGSHVLASTYPTRFAGVEWDNEHWRITTTNLDQGHYQSRMSLANGYLGINVAAVGPFFEVEVPVDGDDINGWPLFDRRQTFATIAGFYDSQPQTNGTNFAWLYQYGGESVISGVPHWAGLTVEYGGHMLNASVDPSTISNWSSTLDMRAGTMEWDFTWSPTEQVVLDIEYEMFLHKLYINLAVVQLRISSREKDTNVTITDIFNGDCAVRTNFVNSSLEQNGTIWTAVQPNGISNVTAYIYSTLVGDKSIDMSSGTQVTDPNIIGTNSSGIGQSVQASLKQGRKTTVTKYIGGASSDAFADPQSVARNASLTGAAAGFSDLLKSNNQEWSTVFPPDSVDNYAIPANNNLPNDPNIVELQIGSVVNPFNLLQNTVSQNAINMAQASAKATSQLDSNSIAVGGLGSDSYAGFIFWDAEVWMGPGLVASHPEAARQIANYRVQTFPQAQQNILEAFTSSQNETGKFSTGGAVFPWTSGRFGNCTGTGPCFDYEYHINGDIGLELFNYYVVSGDTKFFQDQLFPIYDAIAYFYSELLTFNKTSGQYSLLNATDPDEFANFVDDPGYTMALIKTHLETANMFRSWFGMPINQTWVNRASLIDIPYDTSAGIILEYPAMNGTIAVKQADVVLIDDFLDFPNPFSLNDLDYYAGKQSPNGPGMTYGVFSIVANEVSPSGCAAYTYDLYSSQPYTRAPWFLYSEQLIDDYTLNGGTHPAYPFLTGMGGANRVAIFGYLGLRLMADSLNVDPSLPPQIPHLDYRTFYWQGQAINAMSNQTHTTISRLPLNRNLENANSTFNNSPIPVTIGVNATSIGNLPPNGIIIVKNRQYSLNKTVAGNVAQCQPVTSPQGFQPGQFPVSAVDGAASTKWQPNAANTSSWIDVTLSQPYEPITAFYFDWAQSPPTSFSVVFSNDSQWHPDNVVNVTSSNKITISEPYNASVQAAIVPYSSNTTNVSLPKPVWSGNWARLIIEGNQNDPAPNATGATVAEWAIIGQDAQKAQLYTPSARKSVRQRSIARMGNWNPWKKEKF